MDDTQRLRYARHLLLDGFGEGSQEKLLAAHALVVGAGGLGSCALLFLASSGVGRITVADADSVDLTNLQRQVIHRAESVGVNKARSAAAAMQALNPEVTAVAVEERLSGDRLDGLIARADVVLDCSDNFATRQAINAACVRARVPLVSGAAIRYDGQVAVFDPRSGAASCYHCLFPDGGGEEERCATLGVFAPVVGVVGTLQAMEAIKLLAEVGEPLAGRLLLFDGRASRWHEVRIARDPRCSTCSGGAASQEGQ